jgi:hypothetical protein
MPWLWRASDLLWKPRWISQKLYCWEFSTLLSLKLQGLLTQTLPLAFPVYPHWPRDYILIKACIKDEFKSTWEGTLQVVLTRDGNLHYWMVLDVRHLNERTNLLFLSGRTKPQWTVKNSVNPLLITIINPATWMKNPQVNHSMYKIKTSITETNYLGRLIFAP